MSTPRGLESYYRRAQIELEQLTSHYEIDYAQSTQATNRPLIMAAIDIAVRAELMKQAVESRELAERLRALNEQIELCLAEAIHSLRQGEPATISI